MRFVVDHGKVRGTGGNHGSKRVRNLFHRLAFSLAMGGGATYSKVWTKYGPNTGGRHYLT
jgi:hypothetical protein